MATANGKVDKDQDKLVLNQLIRQVNGFSHFMRERMTNNQQGQPAWLDRARFTTGMSMSLIDPRRDYDKEFGYPPDPVPLEVYGELYERMEYANRVVGVYPDECWAVHPQVYEQAKEDTDTPFEAALDQVLFDHDPWYHLHNLDTLAGIGRFGVLLFGLDDTDDLSKPVAGVTDDLAPRAAGKRALFLLYMRAFDETAVTVKELDKDTKSPRCGLPLTYTIRFANPDLSQAEAAQTPAWDGRQYEVHWHRIQHAAERPRSNESFASPRMRPVLNRLLDIRKVLGGSAEMFWQTAFPGISFETFPEISDDSDLDVESVKAQLSNYMNGMQRWLALQGMTAKSLAPQVADPTNHIEQQVRAICTTIRVPVRIFTGSEAGHLASTQDSITWNRRLGYRQVNYMTGRLVNPFIKRMIAFGIVPPPKSSRWTVTWADLNALTEAEKADVSLKQAQALLQYVTGGVETLVGPLEFLTTFMRVPADQAKAIIASSPTTFKTEKLWKNRGGAAGGTAAASKQPARNGQAGA